MSENKILNGVDVTSLGEKINALKGRPELARSQFRASNQWIDGGHNQTTITGFYSVGEERTHKQPFTLDADEPPLLEGKDLGANPVEHLLNALASCLTTSLVYHAAVRGIEVEEVQSKLEGEIDLRGFTGLSRDVRNGYQKIKVTFDVKADATPEKLRECAEFSPVYDVVSHGTDVELVINVTQPAATR